MNLPCSDILNVEYLGRLFDNTTECYKFFWLKAIIEKIKEGRRILSYDELVNEMICSAWYMVNEYHLNLGPIDTLSRIINRIHEKNPEMISSIKKNEILVYLKNTKDIEILKDKRQLTRYVPYRLQMPLLEGMKDKKLPTSEQNQIALLNTYKKLIYYYEDLDGLATRIIIQDDWYAYIRVNYEIIHGWLEFKMIQYLQKRNPNVPGISEKLYPPQERNLTEVIKYWKLIVSIEPVYEIYSGQLLTLEDISIDHFVPWSYVAHDELWNLSPTTKRINSSKNNALPKWNLYFDRLAEQEYKAYKLISQSEKVAKEFEKCAKKHINSEDIRHRFYKEGKTETEFKTELESILLPVYESAHNCGFRNWHYERNE